MNTTRLYRFIVLMVIGMMCVTGLWSGSTSAPVAEAKPSVRKLDADSTDMMAHAAGGEWHDKSKSPLVVDFSPPSQAQIKSIGGMDQWLASQGQAVKVSPRAAVTGKNRALIIRVHFSDSTQRLSNAQLTNNWLNPLNNHFKTISNNKNQGWDFDMYGPVNVSSRGTYVRSNNEISDDDADNSQKLINDIIAASDTDVLEPLLNRADTVILLMDNQNQNRLRGVNYFRRTWFGTYSTFPFIFLHPDLNTVYIDEGGMCSSPCDSATLDTFMWGVLAHEMGHALQVYAGGGDHWKYGHPSNYRNEYELMDSNYPGHVSANLKTFTFDEWEPDASITTLSNGGTQKPSDMGYCLRAIEYDPASFVTPQILKINITGSVWYLVSVHQKVNGDELAAYPDEGVLKGIPDEGVLIERVVSSGNTQWEDLDKDGVIDADNPATDDKNENEILDQKVVVRGKPNASGIAQRNTLWKIGDEFKNSTDGLLASDYTDGITIKVLSNPIPHTWCIQVRYGATASQPDVGIYPWRQPPGESYETTDIWVDSPLNGYGVYRYGSWNDLTGLPVPRGNGDDPAIGSVNRVYARVRNFGTANATDVKIQFKITDPLGVGTQNTSWANIGAKVTQAQFPGLALIPPGGYVDVYTEWAPNPTLTPEQIAAGVFYFHSCIRIEIDKVAASAGIPEESILGNQDGESEQETSKTSRQHPHVRPFLITYLSSPMRKTIAACSMCSLRTIFLKGGASALTEVMIVLV